MPTNEQMDVLIVRLAKLVREEYYDHDIELIPRDVLYGIISKWYEDTAEPPAIQHILTHILTRDQRDALCAANAFLSELQKDHDGSHYFYRVQKTIDTISDMLYGKP